MAHSTCKNCGAAIKNIVTINGEHYGTTCAEHILGRNLPKNFTGSYEKLKEREEKKQASRDKEWAEKKENGRKSWPAVRKLAKAYLKADSEWERQFVQSIGAQAGYQCANEHELEFETYDEAVKNWGDTSIYGSIPTFYSVVSFDKLSEKQISILERILS